MQWQAHIVTHHIALAAAGALQVTISRISGICIGVGVSLLISVIVYPSSATVKPLACMRQVRPVPCYALTQAHIPIPDHVALQARLEQAVCLYLQQMILLPSPLKLQLAFTMAALLVWLSLSEERMYCANLQCTFDCVCLIAVMLFQFSCVSYCSR